jgi:hypothetical protein
MGRTQLRRGVWALAFLTCFTVAGTHTAFAWDEHQPRVEAAGWYFHGDFLNPNNNFSDEVKFGVTGKKENNKGRFEYFNTFTHFKLHGNITVMNFYTTTRPAVIDPNNPPGIDQCPSAPAPEFGGPPVGVPGVHVEGMCDDGTCTFKMDLIDGGGEPKGNDFVCNVMASGSDGHEASSMEGEGEQPVVRGNIKIKNN